VNGSQQKTNVGKNGKTNVGKTEKTNVGKSSNVIQMPTLAKPKKPTLANTPKALDFGKLRWKRSAGKPPHPNGFYWQASGSKTETVGPGSKRIAVGWTLIRNGKCQSCGARNRPPVAYLKGIAWATLQGEPYERQCAEIKILLGKSRAKLNGLRCSECMSTIHGQMPIAGESR
jgi:hypothetical protein